MLCDPSIISKPGEEMSFCLLSCLMSFRRLVHFSYHFHFSPSFLIFGFVFGDGKLGCLQKGTRVAHVLNFFCCFFGFVHTWMQASFGR